jgi:hypothetical protein
MLAGYGGHLISEDFLERLLAAQPAPVDSPDARRALREWRSGHIALGPASGLRTIFESAGAPLARALGFDAPADIRRTGDAIVATLRSGQAVTCLVVTAWGERLDPLWRPSVVEARRRGASWCVLFSGTHVRLVEAARLYSRRHAEFDLDVALDDEQTLAAMWRVMNARALSSGAAGTTGIDAIVRASERHSSSVCRSLRDGVLEAAQHVLGALTSRTRIVEIEVAFEQALTIVYRILFLLFAESRSLVPLWHPVYRESYSLQSLGAARRASTGLWDALRAITRLAHAGCRAGDLMVTGFNGRLFAPSRTPLVDRQDLDEEAARRSLLALATCPAADREGRAPISYRDLGVEQLGAVYETLLDYTPRVSQAGRTHRRPADRVVSLEAGSGVRKATGTFYTPQPLAWYLIRRTLTPLVRGATPEQILNLKVLDPSMGSGAFLVGACAYLAEAYQQALLQTGGCRPTDLGPREQAMIRRTIAERCLYGVDLNPMAVQLARLSLWLATLAADRPLSFLDHHLQAGDSLLGTWLACLRHAPADRKRRADVLRLFDHLTVTDALREALPVRFTLAVGPTDTVDQVRAKERSLAALANRNTTLSKWKRVADLWCSRWFAAEGSAPPAAFGVLSDALLTGNATLPPPTTNRHLREAEAVAASCRFFHWELEFPEVFFDPEGTRRAAAGFDAVIGNPPWDMVRADTAASGARPQSRGDAASLVRFSRDAGVYTEQSDGHANRYQLFVERAIALTRPGGRLGLVLPSGIAADHGSARLRRALFSRCAVDTIVGFENRRGVFPIHRSVRFLLLTATNGPRTTAIACRLGETDPAILETGEDEPRAGDPWFPVHLSPELIERLSGDDLALPDFRSSLDVAIAERAAFLFPSLGDRAHWGARFGRELNASEDRRYFRGPGRGLPVVEGRQIEPFRLRLQDAHRSITQHDADRLLGRRHLAHRLGYRDVASATNRVTLIAALLPPGCVSTHTVFCLRTPLSIRAQSFLCGLFNSLIVNYLARLRVNTHVTTSIVERLPIPAEDQAGDAFGEIAGLARMLGRRDDAALVARLNARVARLYQLNAEELAHVLGSFPLIPEERRNDVLRAYEKG